MKGATNLSQSHQGHSHNPAPIRVWREDTTINLGGYVTLIRNLEFGSLFRPYNDGEFIMTYQENLVISWLRCCSICFRHRCPRVTLLVTMRQCDASSHMFQDRETTVSWTETAFLLIRMFGRRRHSRDR